jgi:hypothetical protein
MQLSEGLAYPRSRPIGTRAIALRVPSEATVVLTVALVGYLAAAAILVFGTGSVMGDALSRVGNAYYVLFSRDPHLAAIGFVWNPLPSLLELPLLPFGAVWPPLTHEGFAANLMSVSTMALAVHQIRGMCADIGLRRAARLTLTGLFALHPMILYYAANGMSEAPFLLFLIVAARQLTRWTMARSLGALAAAGVALGLAYLTRYEAAGAGIAAVGFVATATLFRSTGHLRERLLWSVADASIVAAPFALSLGVWAIASWIIMGNPFETFASVYGNTSQVQIAADYIREATGQTTGEAMLYQLRQVVGLEPLALVVAAIAVALGVTRRDARPLVPLGIFGSVLAFSAFAFLTGKSFGWLRFQIVVIPMAVMLGAIALAELQDRRVGRPTWPPTLSARLRPARRWAIAMVGDSRLASAVVVGRTRTTRGLAVAVHWCRRHASAESRRLVANAQVAATTTAAWTRVRAARLALATRRSIAHLRLIVMPAVGRLRGVSRAGHRVAAMSLAAIVISSLAAAVPRAAQTMADPVLAREEASYLAALMPGADPVARQAIRGQYAPTSQAASFVDSLGLADGSVLVDAATGFPIILASYHPKQFVITPDRDFKAILADPPSFGVRYLLVPSDSPLDAVRRAFPSVYETGAGLATLVREFKAVGGGLNWRLYRLDGPG